MKVERFVPATDSDAVSACYEIYLAGVSADDPHGPPMPARFFAGWLELGWTGDPRETWLARDAAGKTCGWYALALPHRENHHLAGVRPMVHASWRRAGLGTALVRHAAGRAAESGRTLLSSDAEEASPGSAFARGIGARQGLTEVRRLLELDAVPAGRLARIRAAAESAARGYSLVSWDGPAPGDRLAGVVAVNAATADIPREPSREEERWDAERVRLEEHRAAVQGLRWYTVAAEWAATGELAGLTQLAVDPAQPTWGFQELTAVARPHRGHRLGLLVKVAMLELLARREPQLTRIITGNADVNKHMVAINAELGFAVLDRWLSWEIPVADALARHPARAGMN
jgi:GNAT superfamily N-acetyltransferase